jgi:DNA-binding LacI/PurR family transcriptional regulator
LCRLGCTFESFKLRLDTANPMTKNITMAELANLAGVDVSTVSRAINNSPLVKEATRQHVLEIADKTGYEINASARNLRRQSSETIGMVIPLRPESGQTISDPFFLEMVAAVSHRASKRGYDLIINLPDEEQSISERRLLGTGKADGLIIIGQAGRGERLMSLGNLEKKVVVWGGRTDESEVTIVGSDNRNGGFLATDHLLRLGRKRILFLGPVELPEVGLRFEGFVDAHRKFGADIDERLQLSVDFNADAIKAELSGFIDSGLSFDAIVAASDVLAISAVQALTERNINVPRDVAVVGYDNIGQSAHSIPSLTTIDQNIKHGGEIMVDLLLKKLDGETVKDELTDTQLVIRQSCGYNLAKA